MYSNTINEDSCSISPVSKYENKMAAGNLCVCVILALLAGNLIVAEEQEKQGMMDWFNMIPSFFGGGSREKRSADDQAVASGNSSEHHDRLFFSLFFTRLTTCNYTNANETGRTCRDCRTALTCLPSNVGILRACPGISYCLNGTCSSLVSTC